MVRGRGKAGRSMLADTAEAMRRADAAHARIDRHEHSHRWTPGHTSVVVAIAMGMGAALAFAFLTRAEGAELRTRLDALEHRMAVVER